MYQDPRDQITPLPTLTCVRPTAVTASTAQTRHTAGTAPALGFPPARLLGRPALLQQLPGTGCACPRLHAVPSPLGLCPKRGGATESVLKETFLFAFALASPTTGGLHRGRPLTMAPQASGRTGPMGGTYGAHSAAAHSEHGGTASPRPAPCCPHPTPLQGGGSTSPEQTTWESRWKSQPLRNLLFSLQFRMVSSSPPQVMYFLVTLPSWRGACRAGPHPSSRQNTVASSWCRPQRRSTPFTFLISGSPAQGLRPFTSRTSRKVPSAKHTGRGTQYRLCRPHSLRPRRQPSPAGPCRGQTSPGPR